MIGENKFTLNEMADILRAASRQDQANIKQGNSGALRSVVSFKIDLSTERKRDKPYAFNFPFKSLIVENASDSAAICSIIPDTVMDEQSSFTMRLKDSIVFDFQKSKCFMTNPAQPGKFMELTFFLDAKIDIGSQVLDVNTSTNTFESGGGTMANQFPNVHLVGKAGGSTTVTDKNYYVCKARATNAKNSNTTLGMYYYRVPEGYNLQIENFEIYNLYGKKDPSDFVDLEIGLAAESISDISSNSYVTSLVNYDAILTRRRHVRATVMNKILSTADGQIKLVNAFSNLVNNGAASEDHTDGKLIFKENEIVAIGMLYDFGTAPVIDIPFGCDFEITGILIPTFAG